MNKQIKIEILGILGLVSIITIMYAIIIFSPKELNPGHILCTDNSGTILINENSTDIREISFGRNGVYLEYKNPQNSITQTYMKNCIISSKYNY